MNKKSKIEFTKKWVSIILTFGIFWITLSYVLAFIGRDTIAETLSVKVVITILGTFMTYALKACVENVSKNKKETTEDINNDESEDVG